MPRYGLIGKNISHSKSPKIYQNLLGNHIQYDLLDFQSEGEIPALKELLENYVGINITSPYKRHFVNEVILTSSAKKLQAINCLKLKDGQVYGENTDYLATLEILKNFKHTVKKPLEIIILGDGVMSQVCQLAASECVFNFKVLSRRATIDFDNTNLIPENYTKQLLIINCCSRDYVFKGAIDEQALFWDLNYNFEPHKKRLPGIVEKYKDGLELLELQAKYAVAFWSDN